MITFDQTTFLASVGKTLFRRVNAEQEKGCIEVLAEAERRSLTDLNQIAYLLATPWWETGQTMQPVPETGHGRGKPYGTTYYGRGWSQITWEENYRKFSPLVGVDLVKDPDAALRLDVSCKILFEGTLRGLFTGVSIGKYVHGAQVDFFNARRVINGTDHAAVVATAAHHFAAALTASVRHPAAASA